MRFLRDGKHVLAIEWLNRSAKIDPNVAAVQYELGVACSAVGRLHEAMAALLRAISIDPQLGQAHIRLAGVFDFLGREAEAQAAYERGLRLAPSEHRAWARLAEIHLANARRKEAEAAFLAATDAADPPQSEMYRARGALAAQRRAETASLLRALIDSYPNHAEAHVMLGHVLAEDGWFDEATTSIERGIALDPGMVRALGKLTTIRKIRAADDVLMERMNAGLERRDLMPLERQALHFALGKGYDDLGDYATAIRHFDAANRIRGLRVRFDRQGWADHISGLIASTPPSFLERGQNIGIPDATPVLIVGMPRSGTTLVEQILSSHPDVAAGGELAFWGERHLAGFGVIGAGTDAGMGRDLASDYLAVLRVTISPYAARVTDKMPFNFLLLGLIRQVFPNATIVHCRRHPIDTCLSIFVTELMTQYEFAADRGDLAFVYREYLRLMDHWRSVLPSAHFIEVDYEALVADPVQSDTAAGDMLRSRLERCLPDAAQELAGRCYRQSLAGPPADLPKLSCTLAALRTVAWRIARPPGGLRVFGHGERGRMDIGQLVARVIYPDAVRIASQREHWPVDRRLRHPLRHHRQVRIYRPVISW